MCGNDAVDDGKGRSKMTVPMNQDGVLANDDETEWGWRGSIWCSWGCQFLRWYNVVIVAVAMTIVIMIMVIVVEMRVMTIMLMMMMAAMTLMMRLMDTMMISAAIYIIDYLN
jgi:hypothetical protein